jgi:hypothetical protein
MSKLARTIPVAVLAVMALMAAPSAASASLTVGQIAPTTPTPTCASPVDRLQPTVSAGTTYIVPANGTITSWSTNAGTDSGQLKMKIFRKVSGDTYSAVGHDGPRDLTPSTINTFSTSVTAKAGDLLGLNSFSGTPNCSFAVTGDSYLRAPPAPTTGGDLADGESATFTDPVLDRRLNISAVLDPTNTLTFGQVVRNKKKGTATLTVDVPNPGQLDYSGTGIKIAETAAVKTVTAAGPVNFKIKATGKKKKKLNQKGKVKVQPQFTFIPTGGTARTQSSKLKLKKKL